jgi:hypothetical protein
MLDSVAKTRQYTPTMQTVLFLSSLLLTSPLEATAAVATGASELYTKTATVWSTVIVAPTIGASQPPASSIGCARVRNGCPFPVYLWSVPSGTEGPFILENRTVEYSERFRRDPRTPGISLKLSRTEDGLSKNDPHTIFAYTLDLECRRASEEGMYGKESGVVVEEACGTGLDGEKAAVWYDLSESNETVHIFKGYKMVVQTTAGCRPIIWEEGVPLGFSEVKVCTAQTDLVLTLCA